MAKSKDYSFLPPRILTRGRIVHNVAILTVCLLLSFWGFVGVAPADIVPSDQLTTFFSDNFHVIDNAGQAYPNINTRSNDMEDRFNGGLLGPINYNKTGGGSEWTAQIRNPNENLLIAARKSNNETHISPAYDFGSNLGTSTPAEEGGRTNEISFKVFPDSNNIGGDNWAAFIFGVDSSGCTAHVSKSSGIGLFLRRSGAYQIFNGNSSIATGSVTPGADGYIDVRVQYTIPADGSSASQIQIYFNDELIQEISKTLTGNYFQFEGANYTTSYSHHLYKNLVVKSSANYNYDVSNAGVFTLDKNWTTNGLDKRDIIFQTARDGATEAEHTGSITIGANTTIDVVSGLTLLQSGGITGQYTLTKTGEGTLQINAALVAVDVESLVVSSGELDFKGYFEGNIEVFNGSVFSPGNSVGTADITGNITFTSATADSNGVAWFEFGEYADGADVNHDLFVMKNNGTFTADDGVILLDFANNDEDSWAAVGNEFQLVSGGGFDDNVDYNPWLGNMTDLFKLEGRTADGLYLIGIKAAPEPGSGVPEPSTWALLLLGAAGLLYVRKRTHK